MKQIEKVRDILYNKKTTYKEIAKKFNVTCGSLRKAVNRNFPEAKKFNNALGKSSYFKNTSYKKCNACEEVKELNRFSGRMVICMSCNTRKLNPRAYKPNDLRYYVYSILKDNKCIYIGKGTGDRVKKSLVNHKGTDYKILISKLNHDKAIDIERNFILNIGLDNLKNKV